MKSLFWKYLTVTISLLMVSFGLFGAVFMWQTYSYSLEDAQKDLEADAQKIAQLTQIYINSDLPLVRDMYLIGISEVVQGGSNIIVCEPGGRLTYYVDANEWREGELQTVDLTALKQVLQTGGYYGVGNFSGAMQGVYYTCGAPVRNIAGQIAYVVFVSSPASHAFQALEELRRIFVLSGALILFIAIIVSYFVAQSMSRPLKNMIKATREYARGDFSVRVPENRDDEIGELAHSINQMSASLNKLEELRSTFIANVSHELKTPMTTIAGFVDGILDGTIPPQRQNEYLKKISDDTRRLSRLVIRMLEASRIQSGQVRIKPARFNINETVRQTILGFEQLLEDKNIDVQVEFEQDDMYVMADQDNIVQVVFNLVDNACKFIPPRGTLAIRVVREGNKALITIANTGPEIPPEILPRIFDRFYKADSSRGSDSGGAGLGLFIVNSILNMHGEKITAQSENGLTQFTFTLPMVE